MKTKIRPAALAVALLTLASAVFANALIADFQFDDFQDIVDNRMATFEGLLAAPHHTVRPLLKLSYALNGALAGVQPLAFHAVNIGLHLGSVLLVFLLVRRAAVDRSLFRRAGLEDKRFRNRYHAPRLHEAGPAASVAQSGNPHTRHSLKYRSAANRRRCFPRNGLDQGSSQRHHGVSTNQE